MKVYYYYETNQILTEEEAETICQKDVSYDDYGIWEFIIIIIPLKKLWKICLKIFLRMPQRN